MIFSWLHQYHSHKSYLNKAVANYSLNQYCRDFSRNLRIIVLKNSILQGNLTLKHCKNGGMWINGISSEGQGRFNLSERYTKLNWLIYRIKSNTSTAHKRCYVPSRHILIHCRNRSAIGDLFSSSVNCTTFPTPVQDSKKDKLAYLLLTLTL